MLMALMTFIVAFLGALLAGLEGLIIALAIAASMNIFAWYKSDSIVLKMYKARLAPDSEIVFMRPCLLLPRLGPSLCSRLRSIRVIE